MTSCFTGAGYSNHGRVKSLLFAGFFTLALIAFTGCGKHFPDAASTPILLYQGSGTSANDVAAIRDILNNEQFRYVAIDEKLLNTIPQQQLQKYRLLIVPGGDFITIGKSLDTATSAHIRYAVQHGLNYFGICAGAFLAGKSAYYNGFNLTQGATFGFYFAENKGIRKAVVAVNDANGKTMEQYWEDGPQLTGWGEVVAKYPDGTPAIAQDKFGSGFVLLTGIHAEAPEYWRGQMVFKTSAADDNAYAAELIRAALNGKGLAHY